MDLTVAPEDVCEVLKSVRELLKDNILPRISELEYQLRMLRFNTWPVCQSLKERSQITDIQTKRKFMNGLSTDEITELVLEKAAVSLRDLKWSSHALHREELIMILDEKCIFSSGHQHGPHGS